jgi:Ni,Fe-hydrogenase maturation factor
VWLATLTGDLFSVADLLDRAERFVFVDAVVREPPGELVIEGGSGLGVDTAPSLHQANIVAVIQSLEALGVVDPFPRWSLWGVTIRMPTELREGLSEPVARTANALCSRLRALMREHSGS